MSSMIRGALALALSLSVAACASEEASSGGTESLSRELLSQPAGDGRSTPVTGDDRPQEGPRVPVSSVGINRGSVEAPVKVVELSDYGCTYCRQFHREVFPSLRDEFIDTGMVEWKFVPFVIGMFEHSLAVTEAAECVHAQSVEAFETLNERLWEEQAAWKQSDEPMPVVEAWVTELGIDMDAFNACVAEDQQLPRVASSTTLARQLGVRGTPTFVVIGYAPLQGAIPLDMFRELLTAVYEQETGAAEGP